MVDDALAREQDIQRSTKELRSPASTRLVPPNTRLRNHSFALEQIVEDVTQEGYSSWMPSLPAREMSPAVGDAEGIGPVRFRAWVMAIGILLCLWAFWVVVRSPVGVRAPAWDGAAYIDCAKSIVEGRGFLQRELSGLGPQSWYPISLWPPGYSILIAGVMSLGVAPYQAGLAVSALSAVVASLLILYLSIRMFSYSVGVPLALMAVSFPSFILTGTACFTEPPYTVLLLLSLLCLLRATRTSVGLPGWIWGAGLFAGASWCVRNVGLALFAASVCYIAYWAGLRQWRTGVKCVILWLVGWFSGCGWLVWRNVRTFGIISPYKMSPSERGLLVNLWDTYYSIVSEVSGARVMAETLSSTYGIVAVGLGAIGVLTILVVRRCRYSLPPLVASGRHMVLLGFVAFFHICLVVAARTVYRWGDTINGRYLSPVLWAIAFLVVACLMALFARTRLSKQVSTALIVVLLVSGTLVQTRRQFKIHADSLERAWPVSSETIQELAASIPSDQFVLSDVAHHLSILGGIDARYLPSMREGRLPMTWQEIQDAAEEGSLWGLVLARKDDFDGGRYGELMKILANQPQEFPNLRATRLAKGGLILMYKSRDGSSEGIGRHTVPTGSAAPRVAGQ